MMSQNVAVNNSFVGDDGSKPNQPSAPPDDQPGQPKFAQSISIVNNFTQQQQPVQHQEEKRNMDPPPPYPAPPAVKSYLLLSCLVLWFANFLFGLIAFCLACDSRHAADAGYIPKARRLGRAACALNILGILVTVVIITIVLIWHFEIIGGKQEAGVLINGTYPNATDN